MSQTPIFVHFSVVPIGDAFGVKWKFDCDKLIPQRTVKISVPLNSPIGFNCTIHGSSAFWRISQIVTIPALMTHSP